MEHNDDLAMIVPAKKNVELIDISSCSEDDGVAARRGVKRPASDATAMRAAKRAASDATARRADERATERAARRASERAARDAAAARRAARDAAATRRAAKLTRRGPKIKGGEPYDKHYMYPNLVVMKARQVQSLKDLVKKKRPIIPLYVCTIKAASTLKGAKMYFTKKYSKAYISKNLDLPTYVKVFSKNESCGEVRMIMGKGKNAGAQITSDWKKVVEKTKMEEKDIFIFRFLPSTKYGMKLFVKKLK